jgi:hypothetical protein
MTLRQEIFACIDDIPESKLIALKPLLYALADDSIVIETDLTQKEREIIAEGMAEYRANPNSFVPLNEIL